MADLLTSTKHDNIDDIDDAVNAIIGGEPAIDKAVSAPASALVAADPHKDEVDQYMERFDRVQTGIDELRAKLVKINSVKSTVDRLNGVIDYITRAQAQFEDVHDLLVEMNNFFGKA